MPRASARTLCPVAALGAVTVNASDALRSLDLSSTSLRAFPMTDIDRIVAAIRGEGPLAGLDNPPKDVAAAYALQEEVRDALGELVIGWKLAQTTPGAQKAAGIDAPTVAPLLSGMIAQEGTTFPERKFYKPEGEAEIVIELGDEIREPVSADGVRERAAGFRLAIEVADTRYADKPAVGVPSIIVDLNSCGALVIGELQPIAGLADARRAAVSLKLGDGSIVEGLPADARPDPLAVVAFLSRFVTERGHHLESGSFITTGTHTPPTRSGPGELVATFEGIGRVSCKLAEPRA